MHYKTLVNSHYFTNLSISYVSIPTLIIEFIIHDVIIILIWK
jgi:hypothetical protein